MKIDFTQVLKDFDGKPIMGMDDVEVTLGFICIDALLNTTKEEAGRPDADGMIRKYEFARAIHKGEEMDLKAEDIVLLKNQIAKTRPTLIYGITSDMLEKKEDERANEPIEHTEPGDQDS